MSMHVTVQYIMFTPSAAVLDCNETTQSSFLVIFDRSTESVPVDITKDSFCESPEIFGRLSAASVLPPNVCLEPIEAKGIPSFTMIVYKY